MNNEMKFKYEEVSSKHYLSFILSLSFSFLFLCGFYRPFVIGLGNVHDVLVLHIYNNNNM